MKILLLSLLILTFSVLLKSENREMSHMIIISGICILCTASVNYLSEIIKTILQFSSKINAVNGYVKLIIKALSLTVIAQFTADLCRDNGESALGGITETTAKIVIIFMVFPLFDSVITIVNGLIK